MKLLVPFSSLENAQAPLSDLLHKYMKDVMQFPWPHYHSQIVSSYPGFIAGTTDRVLHVGRLEAHLTCQVKRVF